MFRNIRYATLIASLLLILFSIISGMYLKYYTINHIVESTYQKQAEEIARVYKQNVWDKYRAVLKVIADKPDLARRAYPEYLVYLKNSEQFFAIQSAFRVVIFDEQSNTFFNADNIETGSIINASDSKKAFVEALSGNAASFGYIADASSKVGKSGFLAINTFVPLYSKDEALKAVISISYDISDHEAVINFIRFAVIFITIMATIVISAIIIINSRKVEALIERQQEANLEMVQAKVSAEAENSNKSTFLANVSHELRTPLNAIIGFSEMITSESLGPIGNPQYKEYVADIHHSGQHLLSLINDILDYSKVEANKLEVSIEDIDLTKMVQTSLRMLTPRAEDAKVRLVEELPSDHIILKADTKRIKQVILNILSNAVKFTPEGGAVTTKISKTESSVIIEIRDTGVGMAPQDLARALSPFGQVDSKLSKRYEGTGLGLPLTKKLVELMSGSFDMKSEVGLGTVVTITFPAA